MSVLMSMPAAEKAPPKKKRSAGTPYSAFWTERSANLLGEKITKERSLQDVVF